MSDMTLAVDWDVKHQFKHMQEFFLLLINKIIILLKLAFFVKTTSDQTCQLSQISRYSIGFAMD